MLHECQFSGLRFQSCTLWWPSPSLRFPNSAFEDDPLKPRPSTLPFSASPLRFGNMLGPTDRPSTNLEGGMALRCVYPAEACRHRLLPPDLPPHDAKVPGYPRIQEVQDPVCAASAFAASLGSFPSPQPSRQSVLSELSLYFLL